MRLLLMAAVLFSSFQASAFVTFYFCGLGDIQEITWFSSTGIESGERELTSSEVATLESTFDSLYNCDEGVDLLGAVHLSNGAEYKAICNADSLGSKEVRLKLSCEKMYVN